ncbi:MAG: DUF1318 domain-containing protein [Pseudomonadota bacterium]
MSIVRTVTMAASALLLMSATAAVAQDWKAAVAAGTVGEQGDGYLGVVAGGAGLAAVVSDVNIKRKAAYTARASAEGATVEAMGIAGGCNQIKRLNSGEKYRAPDGAWRTVGQGALQLDPRCPQ